MSIKHIMTAWTGWLLLPFWAQATQPPESSGDESAFMKLVYTFLPLLIFMCFAYLVIRWFQTGPRTRRREQHMERVEQSLERIAKAVETKTKEDV